VDYIGVKFGLGMENGLDISLMFNVCGIRICYWDVGVLFIEF